MDVNADAGNHELVQRGNRLRQRAQSRQGQSPIDRPSRQEAQEGFKSILNGEPETVNELGQKLVHLNFFPPAYLPSVTPLAQLAPISISQLALETHHRGTYLLLRVIMPPFRRAGILVLGEDINDEVMIVQLFQQDREDVCPVTETANTGIILVVKEPYFELMEAGSYAIRVDHLSDIIRLGLNNPMIPPKWVPQASGLSATAEHLKEEGNATVRKREYWKAIQKYSDAIAVGAPDEIEVIKRNRALVYLRTKQYDAALDDTNWPNFGLDPAEKALYRAGETLYCLGRFSESAKTLQTLLAKFPENTQAINLMRRALERWVEEEKGNYEFALLQDEADQLRPPHLDRATYIGPVEIKDAGTKGRGVFVTRSVKAGELLICEKAFAHVYCPHETNNKKTQESMWFNVDTERMWPGYLTDLISNIAQKIHLTPSNAPPFTDLYHGDYQMAPQSSVDGRPIVDTFLLEKIMALNSFKTPISSRMDHKAIRNQEDFNDRPYDAAGIWLQASRINHSCFSTATRSFIGDMIVVRANRDLEPGDEVTIWYTRPNHENDGRDMRDDNMKTWGFACSCPICDEAANVTPKVSRERVRINKAIKAKVSTATLEELECWVKEMEATYKRPAHEVPRLGLWDIQRRIAYLCVERIRPDQFVEAAFKIFTLLGFTFEGTAWDFKIKTWGIAVHHHVDVLLLVRDSLRLLGTPESANRAQDYAKTVYRILVGEDETFMEMYKDRKV